MNFKDLSFFNNQHSEYLVYDAMNDRRVVALYGTVRSINEDHFIVPLEMSDYDVSSPSDMRQYLSTIDVTHFEELPPKPLPV